MDTSQLFEAEVDRSQELLDRLRELHEDDECDQDWDEIHGSLLRLRYLMTQEGGSTDGLEHQLRELSRQKQLQEMDLRNLRVALDQMRESQADTTEQLCGLEERVREQTDKAAEAEIRAESAENSRYFILETVKDTVFNVCASVQMHNLGNHQCPIRRLGPLAFRVADGIIAEISPPPPRTDGKHPVGDYRANLSDEMVRAGVAAHGSISPVAPITLSEARRRESGMPEEAESFCWVCPLRRAAKYVKAKGEPTGQDELIAFGGFAYFDKESNLIGARSLHDLHVQDSSSRRDSRPSTPPKTDREDSASFNGPYKWNANLTRSLWRSGRFQAVTLPQLKKVGVTYVCWICPDEMLEDSKKDASSPVAGVKQRVSGDGSIVFLFGSGAGKPRDLRDFAIGDRVLHSERGVATVTHINQFQRNIELTFSESEKHTYAEGKLRDGRIQPYDPKCVDEAGKAAKQALLPSEDPRDSYFTIDSGQSVQEKFEDRQRKLKEQSNRDVFGELQEVNAVLQWLEETLLTRDFEQQLFQEQVQQDVTGTMVGAEEMHQLAASLYGQEEESARGQVLVEWRTDQDQLQTRCMKGAQQLLLQEQSSRMAELQWEVEKATARCLGLEEDIRLLRDHRIPTLEEGSKRTERDLREARTLGRECQVELAELTRKHGLLEREKQALEGELSMAQRVADHVRGLYEGVCLEVETAEQMLGTSGEAWTRRWEFASQALHTATEAQSLLRRRYDELKKASEDRDKATANERRRMQDEIRTAFTGLKEAMQQAAVEKARCAAAEDEAREAQAARTRAESAAEAAEERAKERERQSSDWRVRWREMGQSLQREFADQLAVASAERRASEQAAAERIAALQQELEAAKDKIATLQGQLRGQSHSPSPPRRGTVVSASPRSGSPRRSMLTRR
eukprot:TRINITY_DN26094_c1_g1_i1.p1 TRINITY_DN26094_c1_g1~~TRINITY_DN26094_c1_g1_i1.p1  ORF type:complete len:927 (+),score=318.45 TRINITY_DN26094_c1_g1_i1:54-2783(+)